MTFLMSIATLCLIACHAGPADHFATYAEILTKQGYDVHIYATGPALKKFQERGIEVQSSFSLDHLTPEEEDNLAKEIAKSCSHTSLVMTDLGHKFDIKIQKALEVYATKTSRMVYYDNPEPFVPGGYSTTAAEVMEVAQSVVFANATLAHAKIYSTHGEEVDLSNKKRYGVGFYPIGQAEKIAKKRNTEHCITRSEFLMKNEIHDNKQTILVYFGGNNEEYFLKAFPAFLSLLEGASKVADLKNLVIVIQQHPGAKSSNQDGQQVEIWLKNMVGNDQAPQIIFSDFSSDTAQILADAAFYYQTSMGPQFVLAGIPTVQIGHEVYEDILVRNQLAITVTDVEGFIKVIGSLEKLNTLTQENLLDGLGIKDNWAEVLEIIIKHTIKNHIH